MFSIWSAPAKRSGDGALDRFYFTPWRRNSERSKAVSRCRLPAHSKKNRST